MNTSICFGLERSYQTIFAAPDLHDVLRSLMVAETMRALKCLEEVEKENPAKDSVGPR